MIAARSSRCASHCARRSSRSTDPSSAALTTTTRIPAITAEAALVPCAEDGIRQTSRAGVAVGVVVGADGQQPGQLALRPGVRLDGDPVVAGHLGQPALELVDQAPVAGGVLGGRERVQVGEAGQAHRLHLGGGVELHRAGAERDHAAVEGVVAGRQPAQVAQHLGLGAVAVEHRVLEERRAPQQLDGQRVGRAGVDVVQLAGRDAEGAQHLLDGGQTGAARSTRSRRGRRRPAAAGRRSRGRPRRRPRRGPGPGPARCRRTRRARTSTPPSRSAAASTAAQRWVRRAMVRSPSGPWWTAYIDATTASSTWAVQMLEVALSRRMCCSRVCSARRYAGRPSASTLTPTSRPGRCRSRPAATAM